MATSTLFTYRYVLENPHSGVKWFDGQGNNPMTTKALGWKGNIRTVEAVLAHHADTHAALQKAAAQLYMRAATRMAAHRDTGAARVSLSKGDELDWFVNLEDRGSKDGGYTRKKSALSIEFGHMVHGVNHPVGGLFILTGAAQAMARNPGKEW